MHCIKDIEFSIYSYFNIVEKIWQHELQTMTSFPALTEMGLGKGLVKGIRRWSLELTLTDINILTLRINFK